MNYFVSTTGSDASGDGSLANPWATIDYAIVHAGNGTAGEWNFIIIEAGVYTDAVSEANRRYIHIFGDINGDYFSVSGEIRVERASGTIIYLVGYSGVSTEQLIIENIVVFSTAFRAANGFAVNGAVSLYHCTIIDCYWAIVYSYPDPITSRAYDCLIINAYIGTHTVHNTRGVFLYCFTATYGNSYFNYNCIFLNARGGPNGGSSYGCFSMGGIETFYKGTLYNCAIIGATATGINSPVFTDGCVTTYGDGWKRYNGSAWVAVTDIFKYPAYQTVLRSLKSLIEYLPKVTDRMSSVIATDIFGRPRIGSDGVKVTPGCFSLPNYSESELSLTINGIGAKIFDLPVKAGETLILSAQIDTTSTVVFPQLIIYDIDQNEIDSATAVSDSEVLTVAVISEIDYIYRVWFYSREAAASTIFSEIKLNGIRAVINDQNVIYPVLIGSNINIQRLSHDLQSQVMVNHQIKSEVLPSQLNSELIPQEKIYSQIFPKFLTSKVTIKEVINERIK